MTFLFSLPMDLQVHVLQTWLGGSDRMMLKALSSLDVACTSKPLRQQFQDLASLPCLGWSTSGDRSWYCDRRYLCAYVQWLSARKVCLRVLSLASIPVDNPTACAALFLPFVEHLQISMVEFTYDVAAGTITELPFLQGLLTACPSLSSCYFHGMSDNKLWNTLLLCAQSAALLNLKRLEVCDILCAEPDMELVCQVLAALGPSLEVLRTGFSLSNSFVTALVTYCARLTVLEVGLAEVPNVLQLLAGCKELCELSVRFKGASEDSHQILIDAAANGTLKKFSVNYEAAKEDSGDVDRAFFALFIEMLERYPWLGHLNVGSSSYSSRSLTLQETDWSTESLNRLLKSARVQQITALHLRLLTTDTRALQQLFSAVGANLTEVSISPCPGMAAFHLKSSQVIAIFTNYRCLSKLTLNDTIPKWDPLLELCPGLHHITVNGGFGTVHPHISNSIIENVLSSCHLLKTAEFNCTTESVSSKVLRFIAGHKTKLCLEKLVLRHSGIAQKGVRQFREQIKQQQWLPVLDLATW